MGIPNPANLISDRSELKSYFGTEPSAVGDVPIDVIVSENPVETWSITEHPIEAGQTISDARFKNPISLRLECIITDDLSDISIGSISQTVKDGVKTWKAKEARLKELMDSDELVQVRTPKQTYNNMSVESFIVTQTAQTSQALFFTLELREVEQVASEVTFVDESAIPKRKKKKKTDANKKQDDKGSKKKNKGKKQGRRTLLYQAAEQVFGEGFKLGG